LIFSILNEKGGVGKTTTSVEMAAALAREGFATLLMDLDAQANCANALGVDKAPDLYEVLVNGKSVEKAAIQARPNLYLVRSDKNTYKAENFVKGGNYAEACLADVLEGHPYDVVVLDCAPSAHVLHIAAIVCSDWIIMPTELSNFSVLGVIEVESTITTARKRSGSRCQIAGILPVKLNLSKPESHLQYSNLVEIYPNVVWPAIPTDAQVEVAQRKGLTLFEHKPNTRALVGVKIGNRFVGGYNQAFSKLLERVK
jgi:chromosome partitioning protein